MAVVVPIFDPTNYKQVRARIRKLYWEGLTRINESHAWPRMEKRKIEITDVQHIINYGRVIDHSKPKHNWRYTLEGESLDTSRTIRVMSRSMAF
jgi:hypothetical protein